MPTEEYITEIYCLIDDMLKKMKNNRIRKRGFAPKISDSELVAMEIIGESLGFDCDKHIHSYFKSHWLDLFPELGTRTTFTRQAANLWNLKQKVHKLLLAMIFPDGMETGIVDGFPIPVCGFKRAGFSKLFKGYADYGFCAAKDLHYFGFKGHLLIEQSGLIVDCGLVAANIDEREMIFELDRQGISTILGDKGYICNENMKEDFKDIGLTIHTPLRANMKDDRPKQYVRELNRKRRLIETVIGQLCERFRIEKVRARDLWHLTVRITRKLLAHTVNCYLNYRAGNSILQFEQIMP
jgi:hypothetical protein